MRRLQTKTAKRPQPINVTKWAFWALLFFIALLAYAVWATQHILVNRQATMIGHAVSCPERPAADYFAFCSPLHDGAACSLESQSRMIKWYHEIDYACAQYEPQRPFRFPVYQDVEYVEG
ncbi:MAG: hypothetical protein AAFZ74_00980 [Pseudomonadota bacterium]